MQPSSNALHMDFDRRMLHDIAVREKQWFFVQGRKTAHFVQHKTEEIELDISLAAQAIVSFLNVTL